MGLRSRVADYLNWSPVPTLDRSSGLSFSEYLELVSYSYGGNTYNLPFTQTLAGKGEEPIAPEFEAIVRGAYERNGIVAACILTRALVFSEARFAWRRYKDSQVWTDAGLAPLEVPDTNVTTGEFLFRMEQDVSLAGNWFGLRTNERIRRLRPDWVTIIIGSSLDVDEMEHAPDAEVVGYRYQPGGRGGQGPAYLLDVGQVAHWSPIPDPLSPFRGCSWLRAVLAEVESDNAATTHKGRFFDNAATPNMIVKAPESVVTPEQFREFKAAIDSDNKGRYNAYKNLYLAAGADVQVVGADLKQLDFKAVQGAGETRIAAAARIPAAVLGISEGLAGSSLNAGNYGMARRQFADGFLRPQWRSACAALRPTVDVPAGSELWYDESAVSFLREDEGDAATIMQTQAVAIRQLVEGGFVPETVVTAITNGRLDLLQHTGKLSVQLHDTSAVATPDTAPADTPPI